MNRLLISAAIPLVALVAAPFAVAEEAMTPERFREIVAKPADAAPPAEFAKLPGADWKKTKVTITCVYADGRNFSETVIQTGKYVGGAYSVSSCYSDAYKTSLHCIGAYDAKTGRYKSWNLVGDTLVEGSTRFDFAKKTCVTTSTYTQGEDRFAESSHGAYADDIFIDTCIIVKNGKPEMTRTVIATPIR